ncbi:MAG: 50S ribosomal protein L25 [Chlorobi bacterium]|nr:50S ribosomal protein L25 [Chlorobiota bacterium]
MKVIEIKAEERTDFGKRASRRARREKKIPAVVYGPDTEPKHIYISHHDAEVLAKQDKAFISKIDLGDKQYEAIVKEIQFHPVTDEVLHVDFQTFVKGRPITLEVPVELVGTPEGVVKGGVLIRKLRKVKVQVLPEQLKESIVLDVSGLDLGQSLRVGDIKMEGWRILHRPEVPVATVEIPRRLLAQMREQEESK